MITPELGRAAPESVIGIHVNAATVGFMALGPVSERVSGNQPHCACGGPIALEHFLAARWGLHTRA